MVHECSRDTGVACLATLDEVVNFYDRGVNRNPYLDDEIRPIGLTAEETRALLAELRFFGGLTIEETAAALRIPRPRSSESGRLRKPGCIAS